MLFPRNIKHLFMEWKTRDNRKPLVVRGARQTGKTSAVHELAAEAFDSYVYINLEKADDLSLFSRMYSIQELLQIIQLKFNKKIIPGKTLIFIDEIQASPAAMSQLRYFYEESPALHVIAAGSLLEVKMKTEGFSFPVGRVEYCYLHPVSFDEFLGALHETESLDFINSIKTTTHIPDDIHTILMKRFHEYILVGGMPEAVQRYAAEKSFINVNPVYESIITGFKDDVFKYSREAKAKYLQFIIEHAPKYVGLAVKYENFGGSGFRSREMSEAFDILEKAMIVHRVYPSASRQLPLLHNLKKSPKLIFLDIGLINYQLGLRTEIINIEDINVVFHGQIGEQVAGQMLLSLSPLKNARLSYWYREQRGSLSEVDYLMSYNNKLVPVEVKSGKTGRLKSLHLFMEESKSDIAVRIHSGNLSVDSISTPKEKIFTLLSIPFYLVHRIEELLAEVIE